eukprot:CAMPEP_0119551200 /NCGR_PEP_ID=MMETSP1352-20130426/4515_1 /TAXON_ID=265584 /ORGANISM="Stauroneis constricta, Strain CCMP1120" /LENGTH=65 /DNA_ID=CAMNT_0007597213 /DNA_START=120 /DNA_END=317 /DNA_ORIENTATION=-
MNVSSQRVVFIICQMADGQSVQNGTIAINQWDLADDGNDDDRSESRNDNGSDSDKNNIRRKERLG